MKKLKNKFVTKDLTNRLYNIPVPIVGLTGGIATGKSTVAQFFKDAGIPVIDADKLVKGIYQKKESINFILKHFPDAIADGNINFKTLRELAFINAENQLLLETFIYAQMPQAFTDTYSTLPVHNFIVYDVPLLFEKKLNEKVDTSLCTYAPRTLQLERLVKRDHISEVLAEKILVKQMDIEEKKKKSELVIENFGDLNDLQKNFQILLSQLAD